MLFCKRVNKANELKRLQRRLSDLTGTRAVLVDEVERITLEIIETKKKIRELRQSGQV